MNEREWILGVDLGGTKIRAALVNGQGRIRGEVAETKTGAEDARQAVEGRLFGIIDEAIRRGSTDPGDLIGIGVGSPGPLDLKTGRILEAPNLPSLRGYDLKGALEKKFSIPVKVDNDGNCFALAEAVFGEGRDSGILVGITLGTGMGCGIVMNRRIYHGATGTAAEIWKTPYGDTSYEENFSGKGAAAIHFRRTGNKVDSALLMERAERGDAHAIETWKEFGRELGRGLSGIVNLLDPDLIVLGGSVSRAFRHFQDPMLESLKNAINEAPAEHVRVLRSELQESGVLGAAALCVSL